MRCSKPERNAFRTSQRRRTDIKPQGWLGQFSTTCLRAETKTCFVLIAQNCFTGEYPDCGPHSKEIRSILLLALIVSGSSHASIFGQTLRLKLSNLTQKPDFMFLTIITGLCIYRDYAKQLKCFISPPNSQNVDLNHLLFSFDHFYLC